MTDLLKPLLPFPAPFGFIEWCQAVLKPETLEAIKFDENSAQQCLAAFGYALTNPKDSGTNSDRIPSEVWRRRGRAIEERKRRHGTPTVTTGKTHG